MLCQFPLFRFAHYIVVIPRILYACMCLSVPPHTLSLFSCCACFHKMLSVSQAASSPAVSLVYTVKNGTVFLNGTTASNLLGQLSAELVGYFLFYPPLIIAERKLAFRNTLYCTVRRGSFYFISLGNYLFFKYK